MFQRCSQNPRSLTHFDLENCKRFKGWTSHGIKVCRSTFFLFLIFSVFRVSQLCFRAVLQKLDKFVEPLKLTCTTKVKANSVEQDELKRFARRAVAALLNISGADLHPQLNEFITQIKLELELELANLFNSIQKDSGDSLWTSAEGVAAVMQVCLLLWF